MNPYASLAFGALVGVGLTMMVAGRWPAPAAPRTTALIPEPIAEPESSRPLPALLRAPVRWWNAEVAPSLVESLGLAKFAADLAMIDQTPAGLAARKVGCAVAGLATPTVLGAVPLLAGLPLPFGIPVLAGVIAAAALFFVPDLQVRARAGASRASMRAAAGVFLELVALERAADAGATEALDRAAQVGSSREFDRIRDALLRAELAGQPAWTGLTHLAERTGVVELGDVADIMRLSAADGAAVSTTLRARAASLRTQLLTAATAKANAASEHMIVPVALLGIAFMALLGYPAFAQILFG